MAVQLALVAIADLDGDLRRGHAAVEEDPGTGEAQLSEVGVRREADLAGEAADEVELVELGGGGQRVEGDWLGEVGGEEVEGAAQRRGAAEEGALGAMRAACSSPSCCATPSSTSRCPTRGSAIRGDTARRAIS